MSLLGPDGLMSSNLSMRVLDLVPAGVCVCDPDGVIRYFNRRAVDLWGREPDCNNTVERFCGCFRAFGPDGAPLDPAAMPMAEALRTGKPQHNRELIICRPDGSRFTAMVDAEPLRDSAGGLTGTVTIFQDVTDRKHDEDALRLLAAIVESSDDAIVSKTLDGTITSWNKGAERIFGYTAEEVVGKSISLLMPPNQIDDVRRILGQVRQGLRVDHYETKRRAKDGRIIDVSLTVSPIRNEAGEIVGASKIARDISERVRLIAQLKENDKRKDEFLAMLAHELRNPLSAIGNAVQVVKRSSSAEHREWGTGLIESQVQHLGRMIDDLLDVSRITQGKIELRKQSLNLVTIVNSAVAAIRPFIDERRHNLTLKLDPAPIRIHGDPTRVEQILVNLLNNAAKYTEPGGHITLDVRTEGAEAVITVTDDGIGMAPQLLARAFDLFAQGDRSIARTEGGLGIGLTLVKKLVEMHNGTITATSLGPDEGSTFTIRLPLAEKPALDSSGQGPNKPMPNPANARVLVVDDNMATANGMMRLLKLLGHEVWVAHDGHSAILEARAHRPDVILLDIGLPGMDGYEVARTLREEGFDKTVIIAVSGYGEDGALSRSRKSGFNHHLVKPVDFQSLVALIEGSG